ncbi:MAG: hypothetical protein RIQ74_1160 [Pseudomonadota bacterium]
MLIDEFLIALGVKADTKAVEKFDDALDDVTKSADQTEGAMTRAYEATDGFVSSIEAAMGIVGFFTGVLGGAWAMFHGTIMELEDLIKEEKLLTEVTKNQLEQQKKYKDSVETLGKRFQSLKVELAFGFLPTMQKMIDSLDNFLKVNKDAIVNGILAFLKAITSVMGAIVNFARFIDMIVTKTIGWKATLMILGAAFLWLKRAAILAFVTSPLGLFLLALGVIVLLVDDFMTYMEGGESLLGPFWEKMIGWVNKAKDIWNGFSEEAKSAIKSIGIAFALLTPMLGGVTGNFMTLAKAILFVGKAMLMNPIGLIITLIGVLIYFIVDLIKWLNGGESQFSSLWQAAADVWNKIVDATSQAIEKMINAVKKFIDDTKAYFGGIYDSIVKPFSDAFEWVSNKWQGLKGLFSGGINANVNMGDRQAAGVGASNSRVVNSTNTTNASFIVNGAGNPNAIVSGMNKKLKSTQSNMGGAAKA